jgi:Uma2 family endonuclease
MSSDVHPTRPAVPAVWPGDSGVPPLPAECVPCVEDLVIEDGQPVENVFAEKQYRLLTEPLYSSWAGPGEGRPFLVLSNVGLFFSVKHPPLVPDVMLSVDVRLGDDFALKENRSYFTWILGKPPDVVIEFASDLRGGEATHKMGEYARIGVAYYVIFDPANRLKGGVLRSFALNRQHYEPLDPPWFPGVGLGLTLWEGTFEGSRARWLRWCEAGDRPILTGHERAEQERQQRERLEARLRELGIEP